MSHAELWSARHIEHLTGLHLSTVSRAIGRGELAALPVQNGDGPLRHVFRPIDVKRWIRAQSRATSKSGGGKHLAFEGAATALARAG